MRLEALKIRNLGPFRDFEVNLSEYDGGQVIAIVGANGAGKSTMLELGLPGALYRSTPTRGSLLDLATARDAMVEARVVNGKAYTLLHLLDPVSKKSEAVAIGDDGAPFFDSGKVRDFDSWAAKNLPPPEVIFSTVFQPQGAAGFLGMKPTERKSVLLRILGIEHLEAKAERARERMRETKAQLATLQARIADERERGLDATAADEAFSAAINESVTATGALENARSKLTEAETLDRRNDEITRENARIDAERKRLAAALDDLAPRIRDIKERIENNRKILADAERIRAAEFRSIELADEIRAAEAKAAELLATANAADAEIAQFTSKAGDTSDAATRALTRAERAKERLRDEQLVIEALATVEQLRHDWTSAEKSADDLREQLRSLRGTQLLGAESRIERLRGALGVIAEREDKGRGWAGYAIGVLADDDHAVSEAREVPLRIAQVEADLSQAEQAQREKKRELETAERLVSRAPEIEAARTERDAATKEHAEHEERCKALMAQAMERRPEELRLRGLAVEAANEASKLQTEHAALQPLLKRVAPLADAEARIAELEPQIEQLHAEQTRLVEEIDALPPLTSTEPVDVDRARQAVTRAEAIGRESQAAVTRAEQTLEQARASAEKLEQLNTERVSIEAELADWARLAHDLGKNGLQALEIDAAGPALTAMTNDLLHECHGPRFTVCIETQRLASDGKRLIEGCDVIVIDTERGREAEGSTFSGGERVIIGEAISLALSMLACQRAGVDRPTLVRDESGAALSAENARVYVAMLRKAARHIGAAHVLFVTHDRASQELADARIIIEYGKARVE